MTASIFAICCALCWAAAFLLCGCAVWRVAAMWREQRRERLYAQRYMRMVTLYMLEGDGVPMSRFPMSGRRGAREVLARTLAAAASSTCFDDMHSLRRMVAANGIEGWLLHRIRLSHGYVRARYMSMLSALPVSRTTASCAGRYASTSNRHIRFRTMMVGIAADPSAAVRFLNEYPYSVTPLELAELSSVLRRGVLPLACEPLLTSEGYNLKMLGLNIVRIFGMVEIQHRILDIISRDDSPAFRDEAVYVLVALHLPVTHEGVAAHVRSMRACERCSLLRRLAREGYSLAALMHLASEEESGYAESLAASYKRSLVCTR